MNIRSVDLQVLVPKTTEVGKSQASLNQQSVLQQQYGAEKIQKMSEQQLNQVQHTKKNEGAKVQREEDFREKQQESRRNQQRRKRAGIDVRAESDDAGHSVEQGRRGQIIDIKT